MATRIIGFILVMLLSCAGCKKEPPVEVKKNTTPRDALLMLLRAMREADAAKISAACKLTPEQRPIVEGGSEYTRVVYQFRDAIIAAYGSDAWATFQDRSRRPGDHDTHFVLVTDVELAKAEKMEIEQGEKTATCMMPTGTGRVKLVKNDDGTWIADGVTFAPPGQSPAELTKLVQSLTALVRKYQRAIGKPGITASDIDYELGREIDFLVYRISDDSPHRFQIDKL